MAPMTQSDLQAYIPLVARGKVRELYEIDDSRLLFVTTDRISAYDVIMHNAVDQKGAILTQLSVFWFDYLQSMIPTLNTHYISTGLPPELEERISPNVVNDSGLRQRSMIVHRLKVFPIESIVRGYITGSAWSSYQKDGTICGIKLPTGLKESEKLPQPLWTPSTKAELGENDENISPDEAAKIVGKDYAAQIEALSIQIYEIASVYAAERGIIIADTKFEFALDTSTTPPQVTICDEVVTPDSSRFWSASDYKVGQSQDSYDKPLRNWLLRNGLKGKEGVEMPPEIVGDVQDRYKEAYRLLVGERWSVAA